MVCRRGQSRRRTLKRIFSRAVVAGEKQALEFFNKHQRLLVESAWPLLPWDKLSAWGPIRVRQVGGT